MNGQIHAPVHAPDNPFHSDSPLYRKVRPAYPPEVLERLLQAVGGSRRVSEPLRIADIGAGTGKLSVMLADAGVHVEAVEPSQQMLAQMPAHHNIHQVCATGESTTLGRGSCDAVTFAQSWHWMDAEAAAVEAARIATDCGVVGIVWNQLDVSRPWVHRLSRIMRSGDVHRPDQPPVLGELWTTPCLTRVDWADTVTAEELVELGTTRSSYLRQNQAGRERMQANLRWFVYEHLRYSPGQCIELPYMTLLWTAHRVQAAGGCA